MSYKRKKTSTLDVLHPLARKVADKLVAESNIRKVLSAGVLALNDLPKDQQAGYLRIVSNMESEEQTVAEIKQAFDTIRTHPNTLRTKIEFLGRDAADLLDDLFMILGPEEAERIRQAARQRGPAAIAEGQADDDERAAAAAAAADVARTRDGNRQEWRQSS